jgi:hypothetical protein
MPKIFQSNQRYDDRLNCSFCVHYNDLMKRHANEPMLFVAPNLHDGAACTKIPHRCRPRNNNDLPQTRAEFA